jgi:flagellar hook-associated protein 2
MAGITSAGVGSGLPLEDIINSTLNAEDQPKLKKFAQTKSKLDVELSSLGSVKSALSALSDVVKKLGDMANFTKRTATVKQPTTGDLISVTSNAKSTPGNFNVEVMQLAKSSRAMSSGIFTTPSDVVNATAGKLTIKAGADKSFEVDVAAGSTLEQIRQAINTSQKNFGISVNIINTGSEAKLVVTSGVTGESNDISITNDNADLNKVSTVASGGGSAGLTIAPDDVAKDAIIKVDGVEIKSKSNQFTNAIQDITINALKVGATGEKARLDIAYDTAGVEKMLDEFIKAYNNVAASIKENTKIGGGLYGDSTMRNVKDQLTNSLGKQVSGTDKFSTIFDLGLTLKKDGTLEKSTLVKSVGQAMSDSFADFGKVFASEDGFAKGMQKVLDNNLEANGAFKYRQDKISNSLKNLETEREKHDYRMKQLESRLRAQYAGLDTLIAKMQSSGSALQSQLSNLPGFKRS